MSGTKPVTRVEWRVRNLKCENEAALHGCKLRLRPVLMTALVARRGLIPLALNLGTKTMRIPIQVS